MKSPLYRHHPGLSIFSLLELQGLSRGQETQRHRKKREREQGEKKTETERLKSFENIETKPKFWTLVLFLFPYGHTVITVAGNYTSLP